MFFRIPLIPIARERRTTWLAAAVLSLLVAAPAAAQTGLPFTSDFEVGDFSEWDAFRNTTGAVIMNTGCHSGRCLRTPLVEGTNSDTYGDFYFGDHSTRRGTKVEEVWLRLWSKFDPGLTFPTGQKIAILNLTDGVSTERRYQVILYVRGNGEYALQTSDIANWDFFNHWQNQGTATRVRLGQWDKLKVHVRLNTPGSSNGVLRMWVNDELKLSYNNINIRFNTAYGMNKLILSTYATPPSPTDGMQWHDSITLALTDPDGSSPPPPPSSAPTAPRNVRIVSQ
ncbi:MAG TPA: hypothetical protein VIL35_04065 [Vicinamibacterales bacterium]